MSGMAKRSAIDNPDFVPLAFYLLGAVGQFVDVEDAFVKCYELAPARFGWRKHPFPNYKTASKALRDLEGNRPGILLRTPDGLERQLTANGVTWVEANLARFSEVEGRPELLAPTRRPFLRMLNDLSAHSLFLTFESGSLGHAKKHDVADALLCAPDSPPEVWRERLETFRAAAQYSKRSDVLRFLDELGETHPSWFEGR